MNEKTSIPNVEELFCKAIEIHSPTERATFIADACGDDANLQDQVGRLVDAHFDVGMFLHSGKDEATQVVASAEQPGTQIGR